MQRVRTFPSSIQRHQLYGKASVTLSPSDLAGAHVGPDALPVGARLPLVLAHGLGARVARVHQVRVRGLPPAVQADHVGGVVAQVAVGLLIGLPTVRITIYHLLRAQVNLELRNERSL